MNEVLRMLTPLCYLFRKNDGVITCYLTYQNLVSTLTLKKKK